MQQIPSTGSTAKQIFVDGESVTDVPIDLTQWSSFSFELSNRDLDSYLGPVSGTLVRVYHGRSRMLPFYFSGPPYRFIALPPGKYNFVTGGRALFPPAVNEREARAPFEVGPQYDGMVHDIEVVF